MSNFIVKEQRVDGSWCGFSSTHLRCTLMGFEINYQVRILSYEKINLQRFFSSSVQQSFEEKQNLYPPSIHDDLPVLLMVKVVSLWVFIEIRIK